MSALVLLDTSKAGYLRGLWTGYQTALAAAAQHAERSLPSATEWQGNRADLFRTWWTGAKADFDRVSKGIGIVTAALDTFMAQAPTVQGHLDTAESLVRNNCTNVYELSNGIAGTYSWGGSSDNAITINGASIPPGQLPGIGPGDRPAWLTQVSQELFEAERAYLVACHVAAKALATAKATFESVTTFTHLARSAVSGSGPLSSDPTWDELTGGSVFRMPLSGFTTDPFGSSLMPRWYDETFLNKVSDFIGEFAPVIDLGAIVLTCLGQPEIAAGLEILVHGTKLGIDVIEKNSSEIPWDAIDLVLDAGGLQSLAKAMAVQLVGEGASADVTESITSFIQARLREAVADSVDGDGKVHVSGTALNEIAAEAQGELDGMTAGGDVPPPPPPPVLPRGGRVAFN